MIPRASANCTWLTRDTITVGVVSEDRYDQPLIDKLVWQVVICIANSVNTGSVFECRTFCHIYLCALLLGADPAFADGCAGLSNKLPLSHIDCAAGILGTTVFNGRTLLHGKFPAIQIDCTALFRAIAIIEPALSQLCTAAQDTLTAVYYDHTSTGVGRVVCLIAAFYCDIPQGQLCACWHRKHGAAEAAFGVTADGPIIGIDSDIQPGGDIQRLVEPDICLHLNADTSTCSLPVQPLLQLLNTIISIVTDGVCILRPCCPGILGHCLRRKQGEAHDEGEKQGKAAFAQGLKMFLHDKIFLSLQHSRMQSVRRAGYHSVDIRDIRYPRICTGKVQPLRHRVSHDFADCSPANIAPSWLAARRATVP